MQPLTVQHFDVFARRPGGGNPCPVVTAASHLTTADMQRIAAHYQQECVFVVSRAPLRLRFFVPRQELSMCVHGTIAAITALVKEGELDGSKADVGTDSGHVVVTWDRDEPAIVDVEQQTPEIGCALPIHADAAHALAVADEIIDACSPIRRVSVSRPKLLVPLRTSRDVQTLQPRLFLLESLCRAHDTTGAYVFAPSVDGARGHFVVRQFPVNAGYPEDAATGVAAGALAAYQARMRGARSSSWTSVTIDQGDAMGRPSRLLARALADAEGVRRSVVSGTAQYRSAEQFSLASPN